MNNNTDFKVLGYLPNWGGFLENTKRLSFDKITHLLIAFINPINKDADLDPTYDLEKVVTIAHDNDTKVFISLGGAIIDEDIWAYLQLAENRPLFIQKIIQFITEFNIDGVDIDLEGPSISENYGSFVQELAIEIHKRHKEISGALASWIGHTIPDIALNSFDFINMMSYDETGTWLPEKQGQHSSLEKAENDIIYWNETRNVPFNKLVLGLPFYGYSFNNYTNPATSFNYTYDEIIENFPYAGNQDELKIAEKHTVFYNGKSTIRKKTLLALEKLSGVMVWQLVFDSKGENSLLNEISSVLIEKNILPKKQNPAIFKARWISAHINIKIDVTTLLQNQLLPFIKNAKNNQQLSNWIYTINEKNQLLLFIKTTAFSAETYLKPNLKGIFGKDLVDYKGYYLMNLGFPGTSFMNTDLFTQTTNLLAHSIHESEEWNSETTMSLAIPMQLILLQSIENDLVSVITFFQKMVNTTIKMVAQTQINPTEWSANFIKQLENNFERQKEGFVGFCNYVIEQINEKEFEDEESMTWFTSCQKMNSNIYKLQEQNKLLMSDDFGVNQDIPFSKKQQERWEVLEQYVRFLDGQLNLDPLTACSVHYAIGQSLPFLMLENA